MSELRYSIATGDWVVFATERAKRPHDFVKAGKAPKALPEYEAACPFCPGNENKTPRELFRMADGKGWKVRSVPNSFAALSAQADPRRNIEGIHISMGGFGDHEVIVENRRHNTCIALMGNAEVEDIIRAYKSRYVSLKDVPGIEAIIIFKNHGSGAGTSIEHPHSQLVATPIIPPHVKAQISHAADFYEKTGRCIYCRIIEDELKAKTRVILKTDHFVSLLPYAGAMPFAIWICPKRHEPSFSAIKDDEIEDMARNLQSTLKKLYYGLENPDFNYTIRSYAAKEGGDEYLHWFLNIIPRMTLPAGFELGSGMFINVSMPEESAEFLRQVKVP